VKNLIQITNQIQSFNKSINVEGDKSLSIRWALLASQASGKSISYNLLRSEDVLNTLRCLRELGTKIYLKNKTCEIIGKGLNKFNYKKKIVLDAGNSGTLGRLLLGLLVHSKTEVVLKGDKSLSKRDFYRVTNPLQKFGAKFKTTKGKLPVKIKGTDKPTAVNYIEKRGSAQCKSSVMLAAINTPGKTIIKAKKSRDHTEILFKYLGLPISIKKNRKFDIIKIVGGKSIKPFNYNIPSDLSSSAFFIVLTALSKNSKLRIKNINLNPSRIGILKILKMMNVKFQLKNKRTYKGEKIGDIFVHSSNNLKPINCPVSLNSAAIDEFLLIFLVAAKANGVSYFKALSELNQKESPRLYWGSKILSKIGIKNEVTNSSIKIFGNPEISLKKNIQIKKFLKDHRVFMASTIAALTFGGKWRIHDRDSINTSFPTFIKKIKMLGAKIS
tara:strand:+ start:546 stop:1871 length:1326 start_codon:yes stop_codon:yes gene_type:complete